MKARAAATALGLTPCLVLACGGTPAPAKDVATTGTMTSAEETEARAFIDELTRHDWTAATKRFSREMAETESPRRLEVAWSRTEAVAGAFVGIDQSRLVSEDRSRAALLIGRFALHRRTFRVVFDEQRRIAGFFIRPVAEDLEANVRAIIEAMVRGDMASATKDFDGRMRDAVPPAKLETTWKELLANVGEFVEIENVRTKEEPNVSVVLATCKFARGRVLVKVAYRRDEVAGFFLVPAEAS